MRKLICTVLVLAALVFASPPAEAARDICRASAPRAMRCHAEMLRTMTPRTTKPIAGSLTPAAVKKAYGFPSSPTAGAGQTIAVVAAFNSPHAEADLNVFSRRFGLPECTRANGCFSKVNQRGQVNAPPATDPGWALEISMDVQWAHAIAPGAKILLVQADTNSIDNLMTAVGYASTKARYVTNSWGGNEFDGQGVYDSRFKSTVSYFFSSGDDGYAAEYPTSSPKVISVGGTTLRNVGTTSQTEKGWEGSGGGCSHTGKATAAQLNFKDYARTGCAGRRATPDLSLVADPATGVAVYDSTPLDGERGWYMLGGTSASAPMVAARAAITGKLVNSAYVYGDAITYRDITVGNNGTPCRTGWDFVTGRGSWTR